MRIEKLNENTKKNLLDDLLKRSPNNYGKFEASVQEILNAVKEKGDEAVFEYTEKFDGVRLDAEHLLVTEEEIAEAYEQVDDELIAIIRKALVNIRDYHQKQMQYSWFDSKPDGTILGQKVTALQRVGVYVPGGKAAYPSSVLMNIMPAKVAGVDEIIMVTPPGKDGKVTPTTLVAAKEAGADKVYKVGGAQAIAALAYGTESIPKVDKIVGPGNIYVALAKKAVYGFVSIDSIAGPSEILVLADETANPRFVAADLLSQAEHDEMASAILVTTSMELAEKVSAQTDAFVKELSRGEIIQKSLDNYGHILVAETMEDAIDAANSIASEHLEIVTANPFEVMTKIRNAGAIFIGEYSSEPLGDYFAGPNHVLPTNGTAKFFSPLSVDDFIKIPALIFTSSIHHILPYQHANPVTMIIPSLRFYLDMLPDHIKPQILHLLDIINHRFITRWCIQAVRPVSLIQNSFLKIWFVVQKDSRNSVFVILHFYLTHGKITLYRIIPHLYMHII